MSTRNDSSFEELSYEYDFENGDDYPLEEFVEEMDDVSEGSAVVVLELPVSFLQLNDNDPPAEISRTEDHNTNSPRSLVDELSPAYASANSETLSAVGVERASNALYHVDRRRASAQESFSFGGWSSYQMSTQGSTMGTSGFADFEIISVGGSVKLQCKSCTFIGNENDRFCQSCGLAWCANPCTDLDALIAAQMQFKEEERFHDTIQKEENIRENLRDQPAPVQAQILTNDILRFVEGCSVRSDNNSLTPRALSEHQLYMLAKEFIADYVSRRDADDVLISKIFLYYDLASSEELTMISRGDGFQNRTLYKSLETSFQNAEGYCRLRERADEDVSYVGWIVAVSYHERINLTTLDDPRKMDDPTNRNWFCARRGQSVLPLAYFDVSKHRDGADRIFKGLEQVCFDFFDHFRHIDPPPDGNVGHDDLMLSVDPPPDGNVGHDDLKQSDDPPGCYVRHDGLMERVEL
jgi:hypothetical protein